MGAYLSQPNTSKTSSDGGNSNLSFGFSAMQGWRVSMEVRRKISCIAFFFFFLFFFERKESKVRLDLEIAG